MRCGSLNQVEKTIFAIIIIIIPIIIIMLAYSVSESDHEQSFILFVSCGKKWFMLIGFLLWKKKKTAHN